MNHSGIQKFDLNILVIKIRFMALKSQLQKNKICQNTYLHSTRQLDSQTMLTILDSKTGILTGKSRLLLFLQV
jgi:hypothetical protein